MRPEITSSLTSAPPSRRRNAFRQCDVERAIRAAQATNAGAVIVKPDGSILIETRPNKDQSAKAEDYVL